MVRYKYGWILGEFMQILYYRMSIAEADYYNRILQSYILSMKAKGSPQSPIALVLGSCCLG